MYILEQQNAYVFTTQLQYKKNHIETIKPEIQSLRLEAKELQEKIKECKTNDEKANQYISLIPNSFSLTGHTLPFYESSNKHEVRLKNVIKNANKTISDYNKTLFQMKGLCGGLIKTLSVFNGFEEAMEPQLKQYLDEYKNYCKDNEGKKEKELKDSLI